MAEVLRASSPSVVPSYYHNNTVRRPAPRPAARYYQPNDSKRVATPRAEHNEQATTSWLLASPPLSSDDFPTVASLQPAPANEFSLPSQGSYPMRQTPPTYDEGPFYENESDLTASEESTDSSVTDDTTRSDSPLPTPTIADDTAVRREASRQVDFLSHEWREEDIWSSWRNIVSQRRAVYGERSRLENASWRTWAKSKYRLRTIAPERLNWLKESDVTWLYGPLTTASSYPITKDTSVPSSQLSKSNSFVDKKPILKKRSMSEVMLQNSLSSSSLVKQAAASIQAQGWHGRRHSPASDFGESQMHSEIPSRDQVDYLTSHTTSGICTPSETSEKRHIRFDDRVEQCIAVECKYPEADEDDDDREQAVHSGSSDSSSDEGIVMKPKARPGIKSRSSSTKGSRSNSFDGRKTIETLPATTLKYRTDSPNVTAEAQHHTFGRSWSSGKLNHSSSQETLRPSYSGSQLGANDDDAYDEALDSDSSWSFGASNPRSSLGASAAQRSRSRDGDCEIAGMRRTGSGMFMPYDDGDEDDVAATGFFGKVNEAINTARDIGHVIWTVGWGR